MKKLIITIISALSTVQFLPGQTISDGLMMSKHNFCTGLMATHDRWSNYWEGRLKRENQNIGTITTNSITWFGNYGLNRKMNIITMLPYVMTSASKGTMMGMQGVQDMSLVFKYKFFEHAFDSLNKFRLFMAVLGSTPLNNYTPDFLPLSIGLASSQLAGRFTMNYTAKQGWYVNGSTAYTLRSNVRLDRPSYYTDGKIYFTNEVFMPNLFDFSGSVGYIHHGLETKVSYLQQVTLGGDDIRRQDMPFVSNRMNFSRVEFLFMYYPPKLKYFALRGSIAQTVSGRNVGQSTTIMAGILYTFHFFKTVKS